MSDRPAYCCGVCPPIVGGGYDCTCQGDRNCPKFRQELNRRIRAAFELSIDCHEETTRKGQIEPCSKTAVALKWDGENFPYPVCAYHSHGDMVSIIEIKKAIK